MNNCRKINRINLYLILSILIPFICLCYRIFYEKYPQIDSTVSNFWQHQRNIFLKIFSISIYQFSGVYITAFIVLSALVFLIRGRYWHEAIALAFATLGILILVDEILKPFFDRRRPPKPRLVEDLSRDSFPSGHAAGNLVLYFYLSFILATRYPKLTKYIYGLATLIILSIGFSSIYVNADWATDIIGGYIFGYLWLLISLGFLNLLKSNIN